MIDRRAGIALDLVAQLADEHPQILRVALVRGAPDRGEELAVGHHPAGIAGERRQQIVFARRQLDRRAVARDEAALDVDRQTVDLDPRFGAAPALAWRSAARRRASNSPIANGFST